MKSLCRMPLAAASRPQQAMRAVVTCASCESSPRPFSVLNRPPPNYPGHVPLTRLERAGLALGSGVMSFIDPRRGGEPPDTLRVLHLRNS